MTGLEPQRHICLVMNTVLEQLQMRLLEQQIQIAVVMNEEAPFSQFPSRKSDATLRKLH